MKRKTGSGNGSSATERLSLAFQVNHDAAGLGPNEFEGYASVFGSPVNAWMPTIVDSGAFRKTLQERANRVKVLWQHDPSEPIGIPTLIEETPQGLHVRARISETDTGRKALTLIRDGVLDSLSIGFDPVKEEMQTHDDKSSWRHLKEVKLYEFSIVTFPADEAAAISAIHSVVPFQDLPLGDEARPWTKTEAEYRVRAWAGGGNSIADIDWAKYRQAFVWFDGDQPDQIQSYKLQIADIIDGKLTAVPRAIYACAVVLQGGRAGVNISDADKAGVKTHIARYYKKLDRTPPWEGEEDSLRTLLESVASIPGEISQAWTVQTLIFPKKLWELAAAKKWCSDHEFKTDVDETGESYRFRQRDPGDFDRMRTICFDPSRDTPMDECRIKAVGGPLKEAAAIETNLESLCLVPSETHIGKVLSAKNKKLVRDAITVLTDLLAAAEPPATEEPEEEDRSSEALTVIEQRLNELREAELAFARSLSPILQ